MTNRTNALYDKSETLMSKATRWESAIGPVDSATRVTYFRSAGASRLPQQPAPHGLHRQREFARRP